MSKLSLLAVGLLAGVLVLAGLAVTDSVEVKPDVVCENEFGDEWNGETLEANPLEGSAKVECTNGTATRRLSVDAGLEVKA